MKYTIKRTDTFNKWFSQLKDRQAVKMISVRILRAENGNLGDVKPVGAQVQEMRVFVGPGYRVYFTVQNNEIILLLSGGDKGTQANDIKKAQQMLKELEV